MNCLGGQRKVEGWKVGEWEGGRVEGGSVEKWKVGGEYV